jgi:hypothetical protein
LEVVGIFGRGWGIAADAYKEIDENADWLAHVAVGGCEVGASAGDGDDTQDSAKGYVLLSCHEGSSQISEAVAKSRVGFEGLGEGWEVGWRSKVQVIGSENLLDLFDVSTEEV